MTGAPREPVPVAVGSAACPSREGAAPAAPAFVAFHIDPAASHPLDPHLPLVSNPAPNWGTSTATATPRDGVLGLGPPPGRGWERYMKAGRNGSGEFISSSQLLLLFLSLFFSFFFIRGLCHFLFLIGASIIFRVDRMKIRTQSPGRWL